MAAIREVTIPSPVLGWNARDALDQMDPRFAVVLDNWIPRQNYTELRRGHSRYATALGGPVETLIPYSSASSKKFLAAADGEVWDISVGASPNSLANGFTSDRWQWVQFKDYAILVNGEDTPQKYDGSTLVDAVYTGISDPENLINVAIYKSRLFFAEKEKAGFWYGAVSNITGALSYFDLAPLAPHGGYLQSIGTWTRDSGNGPDDYIAFIMSGGDVLLYSGTDPGNASAWGIVGVFRIAPPLGRRCTVRISDDVLVLTQDGYVPLSRGLAVDRTNAGVALSDNISGAVREAVGRYGSNWGWEACIYPVGQLGIINVPTSTTAAQQHVINSATGAWCRFTGMAARTWAVHSDSLYFGDHLGNVFKADAGDTDNGGAIPFDGKTAFSEFGSSNLKRFLLYRPLLSASTSISLQIGIDTDYSDLTSAAPLVTSASGTPWGSPWGSAWSPAIQPRADWQVVNGLGRAAAPRIRGAVRGMSVRWQGATLRFEEGSGL